MARHSNKLPKKGQGPCDQPLYQSFVDLAFQIYKRVLGEKARQKVSLKDMSQQNLCGGVGCEAATSQKTLVLRYVHQQINCLHISTTFFFFSCFFPRARTQVFRVHITARQVIIRLPFRSQAQLFLSYFLPVSAEHFPRRFVYVPNGKNLVHDTLEHFLIILTTAQRKRLSSS